MRWLSILGDLLLSWILGKAQARVVREAKARGVLVYLKALRGVRLSLLGAFILLFIMQTMTFGFFALLGAGLYMAPWDVELKAYVVLGVAAALFFIPLLLGMVLMSEGTWYRASGAKKMVDELKQAS